MYYKGSAKRLISKKDFALRVLKYLIYSSLILIFSLIIGTLGYKYFGSLAWIDAFLNASMILTGMGPVNVMKTDPGKLFAAFYALYSGIAFLSIAAVLLSPIIHRFLHKFHLDVYPD